MQDKKSIGKVKYKHTITAKCYDRRGKLLSFATNSYTKSHPLMVLFGRKVGHTYSKKIYLHAEILAIIRAKEKQIHKIVIERYGKRGQPLLAAPCPICMAAIKHYGISVIEFTI